MGTIRNPVLRGSHPDPSFLRVGDDFYLATSTFEWWPGIQIHHSRDLIHWHLVGHGLADQQGFDLKGVADSRGIWAPALSWSDGKFFLVYTIVRTWGDEQPFADLGNFLITADEIKGPWSKPVHLNSSGFDPSLFHAADGRKWLVNMRWDFRKNQPPFAGLLLQEYDSTAEKLIGPARLILQRDILIEGPNLYRRGGFYYLLMAEGGTGWNHGIMLAQSKSIEGPYELDPSGPLLTSRHDASLVLQKAGHGELIETERGEWYLAHLCSRPVGSHRRCILGRETAIQKMTWNEAGWLRLAEGGDQPRLDVPGPLGDVNCEWPSLPERDDFSAKALGLEWNSLRVPMETSWLSLAARPGWLRLTGRESLSSLFEQSLMARRLQSLDCTVETCLEFSPQNYNQMAGLICWYNTRSYFYLRITHEPARQTVLGIIGRDDGHYDELRADELEVADWPRYFLRAVIVHADLQFFASPDGTAWQPVGPGLDLSKLSDDYGAGPRFTGAFVGLCAQDLNGTRLGADFDYFEVRENPSPA